MLYIKQGFFLLLTISPFLIYCIASLGVGCLQCSETGLLKSGTWHFILPLIDKTSLMLQFPAVL